MRQGFLFLVFQCTVTCLISQNYFNKHYKIGQSSVTSTELVIDNEKVFTKHLNVNADGDGQSEIITFNLNGEKVFSQIMPNIFAAYDGLKIIKANLFSYGKKRDQDKNINLQMLGKNLELENEFSFNTQFDSSFPFGSIYQNNFIYASYTDNIYEENIRQTGIFKIDLDLNLMWNKKFNNHYSRTTNKGIEILSNGNIISSSFIFNLSDFYEASRLLLISPDGVVLDSIDSAEPILSSEGRNIYTTVLHNDIIIQAHKVDQGLTHPIRVNFYDSELNFLFRKYISSTQSLRISPIRVTAGRGDYFFILGTYADFDTGKQVGIIIKMSSSGEILWRHHYQHPDFMEDGVFHIVYDVEEDDEGDIYCLGNIRRTGEQRELLLFKINEYGCFGANDCLEEVIITNTTNLLLADIEVDIFPNPTSDQVTIQSQELKIDRLDCFDFSGKLIVSKDINGNKGAFDLTVYPEGIYSVRIRFTEGQEVTRLLMKE